jgi:predicted RNase H-like HicB family nuclease
VAVTTYRVTAKRAGDWWALEVPDLPGVFSQAKRLDKAEEAARDAIALMLDIAPDSFDVTIEPELSADERAAIAAAAAANQAAEEAAEAARIAGRRAAEVLTRSLSQRDAGRILGVSFQRVSQLLQHTSTPRAGRSRRSNRAKRST